MGNPLRNAMVYLGLAEEQDELQHASQSHASSSAQPRVERQVLTDRVEPVERATPAPVTPINRASVPHATPAVTPTTAAPEMNEILTVHPKAFDNDAKIIADNFRDGVPVIMNLSQMSDGDARRIIDFASGLAQGLLGKIERVTNRVFLLTPEHVEVHGDDRAAHDDASFFN